MNVTDWITVIFGAGGIIGGLTSWVKARPEAKKINAEANKVSTESGQVIVTSYQQYSTTLEQMNSSLQRRMDQLESNQRRHFEVLRAHHWWDVHAATALRQQGIDLPAPPPLYPPEAATN